ncbi:MAG TPA: MAE_28990/MAE_18760 family HEPN-like nuclease [Puia sp.]|nr:MAE_28990/MAE_18760 family HEPN-like nuclease [Puia sp.]
MKIRTDHELFDKIDTELSWRRLDILRLRKVILETRSRDELSYKTLLRSAIPLIYAHWEGFIKESSLALFNFISMRKLRYRSLNKGFFSLYLQTQFLSDQGSNDFEKGAAIVEFFQNNLEDRSNIKSIPEPIKTRSNLNSLVLKEIFFVLDLDYEMFRGFEVFIDNRLLESRNKIAHGEYREVDWAFYDEIHTNIIQLLSNFRDQIQNMVVQKKYFRTPL